MAASAWSRWTATHRSAIAMSDTQPLVGPDLSNGVPIASIPDGGTLLGHAGADAIVVVRQGDRAHAIGAFCTHYHGPLAEGLVVGDTIRCPWHHACFSLHTGEAIAAPALNAIAHYSADVRDGKVFVRSGASAATVKLPRPATTPESVVIVGAGAAGNAAAEMLRRQGYF